MKALSLQTRRGLYLLTPDEADTDALLARTQPLLQAGVALLQYRNKQADPRLRREQARALLALCTDSSTPLVINDDWRLAAEVGAAGAHLGEADGDLVEVRTALGADAVLGVSCYDSLESAKHAKAGGASYLAFGAFHASTTKPLARRATPGLLAQARDLGLPLVAIGGITPENASALFSAGADFVAALSAVYDAPDPVAAVRAFQSTFESRA
jgi:thiamine-phosphate pyrophosphorylase